MQFFQNLKCAGPQKQRVIDGDGYTISWKEVKTCLGMKNNEENVLNLFLVQIFLFKYVFENSISDFSEALHILNLTFFLLISSKLFVA